MAPEQSLTISQMSLSQVKLWLEELPEQDPKKMCSELYHALVEINQAKLTVSFRYNLMNLFSPILQKLHINLSEKYLTKNNYDRKTKDKIANLLIFLIVEMSANYKLIIDQCYPYFLKHRKILHDTLSRAALGHLDMLFLCFQTQKEPLPQVWKSLHHLFYLAKRKYLLNKKIKTAISNFPHKSIRQIYNHCLLLSLTNPFSLNQKEITFIHQILCEWAPLLSLTNKSQAKSNQFFVDLTHDCGPRRIKNISNDSTQLVLNLSKINNRLDKLLTLKQSSATIKRNTMSVLEEHIPLFLIEILKSSWSKKSQRNHKRIAKSGTISLIQGLPNIHATIAQCHNLNDALAYPLDTEQAPEPSADENIDMDDLLLNATKIKEQSPPSNKPLSATTGELINISSGGICIEVREDQDFKLQTGELLGLDMEQHTNNQALYIGTVRWIKSQENNTILVGVKLLANFAKPAQAFMVDENNNSSHEVPIKVLMLPENPVLDQAKSVITPIHPFKENTLIKMLEEGNTQYCLLTEHCEKTKIFTQFMLSLDVDPELPFQSMREPQSKTAASQQ